VLHWRTADYSYALIGTAERDVMFKMVEIVAPVLAGT
jgi:hypothetical protein